MTADTIASDRGVGTRLRAALLSAEPDLEGPLAAIETGLGLARSDAERYIYDVVRQVNQSIFPPVTNLEIIHTEGCNLACSYCFEKNMLGIRRMRPETARKAVDILFDYSESAPSVEITHFGGEPTLNFRAIQDVTKYAEERAQDLGKEVHFNITTNGVRLKESMAEYFAEHSIMVLLSVDGLKETNDRYRLDLNGKGTFDRVEATIGLLKQTQGWLGAKLTVMPENTHRLHEDVLGLHDLGINQFLIGYATGIEWTEEAMSEYSEQLRCVHDWYGRANHSQVKIDLFDTPDEGAYFGCKAGRVSITAAVNGEISPCSKILALDNKRLRAKLGDVIYGLTHIRNRMDVASGNQVRKSCSTLGIADDFRGGCYAANYEDTGDLFQPSLQDHAFSTITRSVCAGCPASGK